MNRTAVVAGPAAGSQVASKDRQVESKWVDRWRGDKGAEVRPHLHHVLEALIGVLYKGLRDVLVDRKAITKHYKARRKQGVCYRLLEARVVHVLALIANGVLQGERHVKTLGQLKHCGEVCATRTVLNDAERDALLLPTIAVGIAIKDNAATLGKTEAQYGKYLPARGVGRLGSGCGEGGHGGVIFVFPAHQLCETVANVGHRGGSRCCSDGHVALTHIAHQERREGEDSEPPEEPLRVLLCALGNDLCELIAKL